MSKGMSLYEWVKKHRPRDLGIRKPIDEEEPEGTSSVYR
jgi:hypothetical protein